MKITYDLPTAQEYINLRLKSGMSGGGKKLTNAEKALKGSLFTISIRENDELIGFGRIVGDGAITYVLSDIMVHQNYQGKGIGKLIMSELDGYLEKNTDEDAYITLIAVKPADYLYQQFSFEHVEPLSCGMRRIKSSSRTT